MKQVFITGFEPFGQRSVNRSWETAKHFIGKDSITVLRLPISFADAHKILLSELESVDYGLIVMLGETSTTTDAVRLERVALNMKDASVSDNDGVKPDEECLIATAPTAYFTTFPVKSTAKALNEKGHKVKVSRKSRRHWP